MSEPLSSEFFCDFSYILGECKTLWGEREQAMHYIIDCYVAKALLPVHEVSNNRTQAIHACHVAKTRFVTLLSTKVLNSLKNCHGCREELFMG